MSEKKLTPKQARFVEEYLKDMNATQACIRAGYSKHTSNEQGSRLLANVKVKEVVEKAKAKRSKRVIADADYVVKGLAREAEDMENGNSASRVSALSWLGRHNGQFIDKKEISGDINVVVSEDGS